MKFKQKGVFWGLVLILIAVCMVLNALDLITASISTIVLTLIMVLILIHSVTDFSLTGILFALSHVVVIFREYLFLPDKLDSWVIILAGTLIGIGLDVIFKESKRNFKFKHQGNVPEFTSGDKHVFVNGASTSTSAESRIRVSNAFGDQTKYIKSDSFEYASVENSFGNLNVFLDDIVLMNGEGRVDVKNSFGKTTLYVPATFRLDLSESNGFGNISVQGRPNTNPDAFVLHVKADNSFGTTIICCN